MGGLTSKLRVVGGKSNQVPLAVSCSWLTSHPFVGTSVAQGSTQASTNMEDF